MLITATRSGGFSGQSQRYQIDTERSVNGSALEQMLADLDFFGAGPDVTPDAVGADLERWTITVRDGAREHSVTFVEDGSAESARWHNLLTEIRAVA